MKKSALPLMKKFFVLFPGIYIYTYNNYSCMNIFMNSSEQFYIFYTLLMCVRNFYSCSLSNATILSTPSYINVNAKLHNTHIILDIDKRLWMCCNTYIHSTSSLSYNMFKQNSLTMSM